ncbi:MAG: ABC transporter permease [Kiloniellaceae bacterium]
MTKNPTMSERDVSTERAREMSETNTIVIEAGRTNRRYWRDLWAARQVIWILAVRDISVRYKQSLLGVTWVVLRPLLIIAVFTLVFEKIARLPSDDGMPYSLMVMGGMVPWVLFSVSLPDITNSLVNNSNLIGKVFFPRMSIPLSSMSNAIMEFTICMLLLVVLMVFYGVPLSWNLALVPLFGMLALLPSIGLGLWWAALNVRYRDFRFIIPFIVQFGLYVTPIGFSSQLIPERWRPLLYMNPMTAVVDGVRWCISGGTTALDPLSIVGSLAISSLLVIFGLYYFRKSEKAFADVI